MGVLLSRIPLYRELVETSADGIMITDNRCKIIEVNSAFTTITGYSRQEVLNKNPRFLKSDRHSAAFYKEQKEYLYMHGSWKGEVWNRHKNGEVNLETLNIRSVIGEDDTIQYYVYVFTDKELRLNASVFDSTSDGIMITNKDKVILSVNPAFTQLTGYTFEESVGQSPKILSSGVQNQEFYTSMWTSINTTGEWKGEIWNKRKNGEQYPEWLNINRVMNKQQEITHYIGVFSDISERKRSEESLVYLAHSDALTGLPNRLLFMDRLHEAMNRAERYNNKVAVLFIDLDRFKCVNDSFGHAIGDLLLQEVASRLSNCIRKSDTLARVGGDEFTMILSDIQDAKDTIKVANLILKQINQPFLLEQNEVFITPSIGISIFPDDGIDIDVLLRKADTAMYRAKELRNQYQFHSAESMLGTSRSSTLEKSIQMGIEEEQFKLLYQSQKGIHNRLDDRYEALLRWAHPELGMIMPSEFIPIAEKNGMIVKLGEWVIKQACRKIKQLTVNGSPSIKIYLNLSVNQLQQKNFVGIVKRILKEMKVSPTNLGFEITESMNTAQLKMMIRKLHTFRELGIDIALDNFGDDYSTISYINKYPINILKIDKSFIQKLDTDYSHKVIVQALISMSHELGLEVVAEGVESERQLEYLITMGCDYVQGFLISQPIDILPQPNAYT